MTQERAKALDAAIANYASMHPGQLKSGPDGKGLSYQAQYAVPEMPPFVERVQALKALGQESGQQLQVTANIDVSKEDLSLLKKRVKNERLHQFHMWLINNEFKLTSVADREIFKKKFPEVFEMELEMVRTKGEAQSKLAKIAISGPSTPDEYYLKFASQSVPGFREFIKGELWKPEEADPDKMSGQFARGFTDYKKLQDWKTNQMLAVGMNPDVLKEPAYSQADVMSVFDTWRGMAGYSDPARTGPSPTMTAAQYGIRQQVVGPPVVPVVPTTSVAPTAPPEEPGESGE